MPAPTLAGNTLAYPNDYDESREFRGGVVLMADATQHMDLVQAGAKKRFRLTWVALTAAQKSTLQTAFDAMVTSGSATYADMDGTAFTVTADGEAELTFRAVRVAGGTRWATEMGLREG
ncbi:MAG: hypothetical protein WBO46_18980 [Caldilineaceae bacterium]